MTTQHVRLARLRTRWSAIGAAVAVSLGAGGIGLANAAIDSGDKPVTVTIDAERILDTRTNIGLAGRFADATPRDLQVTGNVAVAPSGSKTVVPSDATGVLVNVTVVFPSDPGFLALRAGDATGPPASSTVNFFPGSIEPNAATVDLSPTGTIEIWVETSSDAGNAHVLLDVVGYTIDHTHDDRYYTEAEVDAELAKKANSADVYTKTEADAAHAAKADSADVYTKSQVDAAVAPKADSADVYTKSQVDAAVAPKADSADVYTKAEVDALLAAKTDTPTGTDTIRLRGADFRQAGSVDNELTYYFQFNSWVTQASGGPCLVASIDLPAGATVTELNAIVQKDSPAGDISLRLDKTTGTSGTGMAALNDTGGPMGLHAISTSSITDPVVSASSDYAVWLCLTAVEWVHEVNVVFTHPT